MDAIGYVDERTFRPGYRDENDYCIRPWAFDAITRTVRGFHADWGRFGNGVGQSSTLGMVRVGTGKSHARPHRLVTTSTPACEAVSELAMLGLGDPPPASSGS